MQRAAAWIISFAALMWIFTIAIEVDHPLWIGLQATAWIAVLLLIAVLLHRWWLRGIFVLILIGALTLPQLSEPSLSASSDMRVVSINTQIERADRGELMEKITELQPDLVVLIETTDAESQALSSATGLAIANPIRGGGRGVAILGQSAVLLPELPASIHQFPRVHLGSNHDGADLVGVHTAAPVNDRLIELWHEDFDVLSASAAQLLVGDFNATATHLPMRGLKEQGYVDCAPSMPTWPAKLPIIAIDHILVRDAQCSDSGTFTVDGGDHLGVWADIRF